MHKRTKRPIPKAKKNPLSKARRTMKPSTSATKSGLAKCPDCGVEYTAGAPHVMFCPAHTCNECGSSFSYALPVYDSRPESCDEDGNPMRLCEQCLAEVAEAFE